MITRLVQSDQNPIHVTQLSGHKNLKSLDSYSVASKEQQKRMSHIISGTDAQRDNAQQHRICQCNVP